MLNTRKIIVSLCLTFQHAGAFNPIGLRHDSLLAATKLPHASVDELQQSVIHGRQIRHPEVCCSLTPDGSSTGADNRQALDIQVICSDVDGTLLTPSHDVTGSTVSTVFEVMKKCMFCACTGRGRAGAYNALGPIGEALRERKAPGVFLNGLLVYGPDGEVLSQQFVPNEVATVVASFADEHGLSLVGFSGDRIVCSTCDRWTDTFTAIKEPAPEALGVPWSQILRDELINKLILVGDENRLAGLRPLLEQRLGDTATITMAIKTMLEVLPRGGSKGAGVQKLLQSLGVLPENVMALGDAENDLGMLELAGLSVAMGNAPENVQSVADHVSSSNSEDGAAMALNRFILGQ